MTILPYLILADRWSLTGIGTNELKTILSSRQRFPRPTEPYRVLKFFGSNIVTAEFDEWKRYRKIAAPAFSEVRHYQWI